MITSATLAAIVECSPECSMVAACDLLAIVCEVAGLASVPHANELPRAKRVLRALDTIDELEDLATRKTGVRMPLRCWRACLTLRAMIARGRPVVHDRRSHYLADDETGDEPQAWLVGPRLAANDNAATQRRIAT